MDKYGVILLVLAVVGVSIAILFFLSSVEVRRIRYITVSNLEIRVSYGRDVRSLKRGFYNHS